MWAHLSAWKQLWTVIRLRMQGESESSKALKYCFGRAIDNYQKKYGKANIDEVPELKFWKYIDIALKIQLSIFPLLFFFY